MNPQFDSTPGLRLPQPSVNSGLQPTHQAPALQPVVSQNPQSNQIPQNTVPPQPQFAGPVVQPQVSPLQPSLVPAQSQPEQAAPQQVVATSPQPVAATPELNDEAADEAWVEKARAIAAQYQSDPYAQSRALSKLKAEYMLARHGKTLKVAEG